MNFLYITLYFKIAAGFVQTFINLLDPEFYI